MTVEIKPMPQLKFEGAGICFEINEAVVDGVVCYDARANHNRAGLGYTVKEAAEQALMHFREMPKRLKNGEVKAELLKEGFVGDPYCPITVTFVASTNNWQADVAELKMTSFTSQSEAIDEAVNAALFMYKTIIIPQAERVYAQLGADLTRKPFKVVAPAPVKPKFVTKDGVLCDKCKSYGVIYMQTAYPDAVYSEQDVADFLLASGAGLTQHSCENYTNKDYGCSCKGEKHVK